MLKPKLKKHLLHTEGSKLIVEDEARKCQVIFSPDRRGILDAMDGQHTLQEMITHLYEKQGHVSFKAVFETLARLYKADLIESPGDYSKLDLNLAKTPHDQKPSFFRRPLFEKILASHIAFPLKNQLIFYVLCAVIVVLPLFLPGRIFSGITLADFLKINGSYDSAIPFIMIATSSLLTFKYILKMLLQSLATGGATQPSIRIHWIGPSFGVTDNSIYAPGKTASVITYAITSSLLYVFAASIICTLAPDATWNPSLKVLAVILSLTALDPYKRSELTQVFTFFYHEDQMAHLVPYLKNRILASVMGLRASHRDEIRYAAYSLIALAWAVGFGLFALNLVSANHESLVQAARYGGPLERISAAVVLLLLVVTLIYFGLDLLGTLLRNILFPLVTPLKKAIRKIHSNENKSYSKEKLSEVLKTTWLSEDLSPQGIDFLLQYSRVVSFKQGTRLIIQDTPGRELYFLLKGSVDVLKRERSGLIRRVATLWPGSVVGEVSILKDVPRTADVVAKEAVDVLVVEKPVLEVLFKQSQFKSDRDSLMKKIALMQYLCSSRMFRELPYETSSVFSKSGFILSEPAGYTITRQGDREQAFYLILRGAVQIKRDGLQVGELKEGDFFGEVALLANSTRTATVETTEESLLLKLDSKTFWEILTENIGFAMYIEAVSDSRRN